MRCVSSSSWLALRSKDDKTTSPLATIDADAYPHIIDSIIDLVPYPSLLALRRVSHSIRARVDAFLCRHLVIRAPVANHIPGAYFYTLREPGTHQLVDEPGYALPVFAFYEDACDTVYNHFAMNVEEAPETDYAYTFENLRCRFRSEVDAQRKRAKTWCILRSTANARRNRAKAWCIQASSGVRELHLVGEVKDTLNGLSAGIKQAQSVRCIVGRDNLTTSAVTFLSTKVEVLIDLPGSEKNHKRLPCVPALAEGITTLTVAFKLPLDQVTRLRYKWPISHNIPTSLSAVNVLLIQSAGEGRERGVRFDGRWAFGFLYPLLAAVIPLLNRATLTLVGLSNKTEPYFNLEGPLVNLTEHDSNEVTAFSARGGDECSDELKAKFYHTLEKWIRNSIHTFGYPYNEWTEHDIKTAIANVYVYSVEEWRAAVDDDEWERWRVIR